MQVHGGRKETLLDTCKLVPKKQCDQMARLQRVLSWAHATTKNATQTIKIAKVGATFCPKLNKPSSNGQIPSLFLPKQRNVDQSGRTAKQPLSLETKKCFTLHKSFWGLQMARESFSFVGGVVHKKESDLEPFRFLDDHFFNSFVRSFVRYFVRSFVRQFVRLYVRSFVRSFVCSRDPPIF